MAALWMTVVVCVAVTGPTYAHVALTYPPARRYDLDFLDNSRTKAPCGMPKGPIKTSILSGSKFNITWHLAYPHRGGFKLHILDHLERPVLDLTPTIAGSEFVSGDVTAQSFEVQLPPEYTCKDCTIRLLRQASEWGSKYRFWSCADVDIKIRKDYRESCSGHGRYLLGRCKCDRLYYGAHCQYRDECWEDTDCGDHGKCVDVKATTPPGSQCYCLLGWFGPGCNKRSPVKSTNIDFGLYIEKKLSDTFRLYWRILKEHKEIEVVMVVNSTSYVGLGWRPRHLTSSCKNFPLIGNPVEKNENSGSAEPESSSEPTSKAEPNSEPEPTSSAEPSSSSEPEPTTEPESKAEPTGRKNSTSSKLESLPTAEPASEPEITTFKPTTKKSLYFRRSALPSSVVTSEHREEAVATSVSYKVTAKQGRKKRETDKESVAEPTSEPEPTQSIDAAPEPESVSEPTSKSIPNTKSNKSLKSNSSATPEPTSVAEPNSKPEPNSKTEPNSKAEPDSVAEPASTSEPEPNSSSEPEPGSVSEPEPNSNSEPEPHSTTEPISKSEPNSEPEPNSNSKTNAKLQNAPSTDSQAKEHLNPYTPRHDFNAMDCTDIVIGSARGTASRIADYYTRDRSTPRMDSYWGGKNDLTAAMGFEENGITTIVFRKKLNATEMSDHSIEEDLMHVIWAQGQEIGKYVHSPKSGLEKDNAALKDFYRADELKYHGHGAQRGQTTMNFFEENKKASTAVTVNVGEMPNKCLGEWKVPRTCVPENNTCEYSAQWQYFARKDEIRFTITTSHTDKYTGIGFSNNEMMTQTDAILGWVDKTTGRSFLMDTWILGYTQPRLDDSQDIYNIGGRIQDGVTTLSFSRKRATQDTRDLSFTDTRCYFMIFVVYGGQFNGVNKRISKHVQTPIVSPERICIGPCGDDGFDDYDVNTTPEPPRLGYNVEVKIVNLGENYRIPESGTSEFTDLSNRIESSFTGVLNKIPGYRKLLIENIKKDNNDVIALMRLQLDKESVEKGRSLDDKTKHDEEIHKIFEDTIGKGQVGALRVDPVYLVFEAESLTSNIIMDSSTVGGDSFFQLSQTKLYVVLGCLAALVLVAIVQASCTIYRTTHTHTPSHKDHLIPNSAWKDYSTANTNYAFEAFEPEEKLKNGHQSRNETLPNKPNTKIMRPTTRPPSVPPPVHGNGNYMADTRSLQRPRGPYPPGTQERSTLSLPRTAYDRHRTPPDMQPDFYFMPSQRKYSGEVVRVYVDYNNAPK